MSSWGRMPGIRRPQTVFNGGTKAYRPCRMSPYPVREERPEAEGELHSFTELEDQQQEFSDSGDYERKQTKKIQNASPEGYGPAERRRQLHQRFYKQALEESDKRPADCVMLSVTGQDTDYAKSIGHCLQERGLVVEMIYLQAESGLTQALQDVRADGSPLCILIEQANVALSSCTIIIFSESLKIHRNMPKEQAMDFVEAEFRTLRARQQEKAQRRAADMADDYLDREQREKHVVPPRVRRLLALMADGLHLRADELRVLADYMRSRQEQLQESSSEGEEGSFPVGRGQASKLGKPPPLLPTPPALLRMDLPGPSSGLSEPPLGSLLPIPGPQPKTKPPPLLSAPPFRAPRCLPPQHGSRGPPPAHSHAVPPLRGAPSLRGAHGAPPSLKSLPAGEQPGLLPHPDG